MIDRRLAALVVLLPLVLFEQPPAREPATAWADCLACHPSPGAALPLLSELRALDLTGRPAKDCAACHSPAELLLLDSDWTHPVRPVGAHLACIQCHPAVSHSAAEPPPMPRGDYNAEGCYACHRPVDAARRMTSAHRHSSRVQCRDCHPAHAPLRIGLPIDALPATLRAARHSYDYFESNRMCLTCHPQGELFAEVRRGFATTAAVNLHDLHVRRGRSLCIECHAPHGGLRKAMLREQLLDGAPLIYREDFEGGNCTTVCHGVEHYRLGYSR